MSTNAHEAKLRRNLKKVEAHKAELKKPEEQRDQKKVMPGREIGRASCRERV